MSPEMQHCIEQCTNCHQFCIETLSHCLQMGGRYVEANHVTTMLDCIEICQTSADFMLRGSGSHIRTWALCADVCEECAQSCEQIVDDRQMERCAEICRHCSESCREMAGRGTRAA